MNLKIRLSTKRVPGRGVRLSRMEISYLMLDYNQARKLEQILRKSGSSTKADVVDFALYMAGAPDLDREVITQTSYRRNDLQKKWHDGWKRYKANREAANERRRQHRREVQDYRDSSPHQIELIAFQGDSYYVSCTGCTWEQANLADAQAAVNAYIVHRNEEDANAGR